MCGVRVSVCMITVCWPCGENAGLLDTTYAAAAKKMQTAATTCKLTDVPKPSGRSRRFSPLVVSGRSLNL
jgi:hypothetical protein